MRKLLRKIDRRFQLSRPNIRRPGSVLILVVALLVLMALIGTAFLSTQRVDRYNSVQHTNNTEIDLLLEGVKNMAKATIVGSLNDPSLPFPYRPANSTLAKTWDMPDLYHPYTDDPLIPTTPNDAWLSTRCPSIITTTSPPTVVWPCIGEPLTGNVFESPFVFQGSQTGSASSPNVALTYRNRMTYDFVPIQTVGAGTLMPYTPALVPTNRLTPTYATFTYQDGTPSPTFPAFVINGNTYLAGDADGDGIADCGMFKIPVGQINGITYYAGYRIIDNCAAINVNTAFSRRYDLNANGTPTRYMTVTTPASDGPPATTAVSTANYNGIYNLGCFASNIGLAELLETYDGSAADNAVGTLGIGTNGQNAEITNLLQYRLNYQLPTSGVNGVFTSTSAAPMVPPVAPSDVARPDFAFTTLGDLFSSQIGRSPSNPGYSALGYSCLPFGDTDAADLCYRFVFDNPNTGRTQLELALHNSVYDDAPNGPTGPPGRSGYNFNNALPGVGATSYAGSVSTAQTVVSGWYEDNFDWSGDFPIASNGVGLPESCLSTSNEQASNAGQYFRPRRSIFTADSAVSNLTPRPVLTAPGYTVAANGSITIAAGMSPVTPTLCKASANTALFADLWRAFWLSMATDNGLSPLGTNSGSVSGAGYSVGTPTLNGTPTPYTDHDLTTGQSIYTGSQFTNPTADINATGSGYDTKQQQSDFAATTAFAQHPQEMFRSPLRIPASATSSTNVFYGGANSYSYIEADQMVLLRSAIAAANVEAMRDPLKGSGANIHAHDISLVAKIDGAATTVTARVFGVTQQPYISEVYANTNVAKNADIDGSGNAEPTSGLQNTFPYVAIELFNPYNQPINLAGWQLAVVNRSPNHPVDKDRAFSSTSVIYTFGAVTVPAYNAQLSGSTAIYQGGYALLEDYNPAGGGQVLYRPASSNLPMNGSVSRVSGTGNAGAPLADIFVPNLYQVVSSSNASDVAQELVLLRPGSNAGTAESQIDQVPVDSYDFTGLTYDTSATPTNADVWHYARGTAASITAPVPPQTTPTYTANNVWRFIYPGRYDATDPTPYQPTAFGSAAPTPVATGSGRLYSAYTYSAWSRRQQGTEAAHWNPSDTLNPIKASDPFINAPLSAPITLGGTALTTNYGPNDNPNPSYPVSFPFQYLNTDEPGTSPLVSGVNAAPFGQFARNSDLLQVPYVGSYIVFATAPATAANGTPAALAAPDLTAGNVIEVNSMPMDCSFAEDTDVTDDPPPSDATLGSGGSATHYIWNESVGHFAPVNTNSTDNSYRSDANTNNGFTKTGQTVADSDYTLSYTNIADPDAPYKPQYSTDSSSQEYWRYHWASRLFDYLTVQNPNDDYFPNVQENTYLSATGTYSLPVQNTATISPAANATAVPPIGASPAIPANPNAEDTVPVYGPININTAPWRVLSALRLCPYDDAEAGANMYTPSNSGTPGGPSAIPVNTLLAQQIALWRDSSGSLASAQATAGTGTLQNGTYTGPYPYTIFKGPFTSISDLLNVPAVQTYLEQVNFQTQSAEPDDVQGHLLSYTAAPATPASPTPFHVGLNALTTPASPITDGVRNDVEERFDFLSRLSNQITTKSDVYTVYIVIQGWRNAGSTSTTNPPQMVTQKRAAFIIDRTGVTPTSSNVKIINVPTD